MVKKIERAFSATFDVPSGIKVALQAWADSFAVALYLDHNDYPIYHSALHSWEVLVAAGVHRNVSCTAGEAFDALRQLRHECPHDWLFGYLSYDLKNELEDLHSARFDGLQWPDLFFFQPEYVVGVRNGQLHIYSQLMSPEEVLEAILQSSLSPVGQRPTVALTPRMPREEYLHKVELIRQHIAGGDIYELNFCQEFFAENIDMAPLNIFQQLNQRAAAPFSAYLKKDHHYLLCASPERYLRKQGNRLVTQPIKGTRRRSSDAAEDAAIRTELAACEKDRAENVMIVDLVRNDLAHDCLPGTIRVDELFGIYTFPTVHQMISTVSGQLPPGDTGMDALRSCFPMGSMTGAPKVMSMHLIEQYETTRRGLFSGAVGYFDPEGNYDFNVVIRSIQYRSDTGYLSCMVGGAIVYDSVPEQEYEECLTKIKAIRAVLANDVPGNEQHNAILPDP